MKPYCAGQERLPNKKPSSITVLFLVFLQHFLHFVRGILAGGSHRLGLELCRLAGLTLQEVDAGQGFENRFVLGSSPTRGACKS